MNLDRGELFIIERGTIELAEVQTMFGTRPGGYSRELCGIIFKVGEINGDFAVAIVQFSNHRGVPIGHTMVLNLREWVVYPVTKSFLTAALPEPELSDIVINDDVDLIDMIENDPACSTFYLMGENGSEEG